MRFDPREQVICVPPAPPQKEATANEREADFHANERVADIQRAIRKVKAKAANRAKPAGAPSGKASSSKREWPRGSVLPEKRSLVTSIPWFETEPDVEEQDKKRLRQEREMIEMRGEVPWYLAKECVRDFWSCGYCQKVNMTSSRLCRFGECRKPRPEELALNNLRHEGPQMLKAWIHDNPSLQPGSTQLSQWVDRNHVMSERNPPLAKWIAQNPHEAQLKSMGKDTREPTAGERQANLLAIAVPTK